MSSSVADKIHQQFSQYPKRVYPKGQIIVFANENPEYIFYLTSGRVRQYDISYRGDEIIVNIFKPPAFFAMSWAINHTPNSYFYKTEAKTELHIIPLDDALNFLKANPDVTLDLLSRVYRGVEGLLGRVVHLMSGTAKSRLVYELLIECRRFGEPQADGSYILKGTNEGDFAARSGLARETISREIHKLQEQGWVKVSKRGIVVSDIKTLERTIGPEI